MHRLPDIRPCLVMHYSEQNNGMLFFELVKNDRYDIK